MISVLNGLKKPVYLFLCGIGLCGSFGWACQGEAPGTAAENMPIPAAVQINQRPVPRSVHAADTAYLMGKFKPERRNDFVRVGKPYTDRANMMLRTEAFAAFQKMYAAAKKEGISLKIISSTRTFDQQKSIWQAKWERFAGSAPQAEQRARKILEYSSMPGTSRHHWGTDVDLNDLNNSSFEKGGPYEKTYQWLAAHAQEYGFCQPYTPGRSVGYQEEKWHWSYLPLSQPLLAQYLLTVTDDMLSGFKGSETAKSIRAVEDYVGGINRACQ